MARRKRGRPPKKKFPKLPSLKLDLHDETKQSLAVVLFTALAILTTLSLLNISGSLGRMAVKGLRLAFGWGAFLLPVFFALIAIAIYKDLHSGKNNGSRSSTHSYVGITVLSIVVITFLQLIASRISSIQFNIARNGEGGGFIGAALGVAILKTIGPWAGFVLLSLGVIAGVLVAFNIPLSKFFALFKTKDNDSSEDKKDEKPEKKKEDLKINDPSRDGFKKESVGKANPVAAALSKKSNKKLPNFLSQTGGSSKSSSNKSKTSSSPTPKRTISKNWKYPPLDLLEESNADVDSGDIEANVAIIQKTLADFDIDVEMGEVNIGPTVTQYTLRPADGVRLSAVEALQKDLKMALAAPSIRIEAPIPGRSLVGIEIPNQATALVRLRELFETDRFQNHNSPLAFALGRDVAGKGIIEDLSKMPHLLVAGATGSGKSVSINVVLTSFLMRNTPDDAKFIIIDPKRVEMSLYNDIPHLITPIITDHKKAVNALRWTVAEMDRRYQLFSEARKRNIGEYNESAEEKLPFLVVIVDELADLMAVARNDVEATVVRLAQMARAVGIHLILATQRPSVDIITGLIKANITSRIAFAVASQVDSRTILDQAGAEKLLGKGDMLYITSEMNQPKRIQGALISEKEVKKITDFLRKEASPDYNESVTEKVKVSSADINLDGGDEEEPLLEDAKNTVIEAGKASASLLQRKLRIGYARAARILDMLEEQGLVGPQEGSKARDVYVSKEQHSSPNFDNQENQESLENDNFSN